MLAYVCMYACSYIISTCLLPYNCTIWVMAVDLSCFFVVVFCFWANKQGGPQKYTLTYIFTYVCVYFKYGQVQHTHTRTQFEFSFSSTHSHVSINNFNSTRDLLEGFPIFTWGVCVCVRACARNCISKCISPQCACEWRKKKVRKRRQALSEY